MRKFYLLFKNRDTLCHDLSWPHYRALLKVENELARNFYIEECKDSSWSVRELSRQINSFYYERLIASKDKESVMNNMLSNSEVMQPQNVIKDPYVLELGRGFSFVGRHKRFQIDDQNFFIDLVFYNYILKYFVLIDLKVGKLKHQDIGQMQMYVNYYTRELMNDGENLPIWIVLCAEKQMQ